MEANTQTSGQDALVRTIKVPVKTCSRCGETFVNGYHGSVGITFWLTAITGVGGIVYWAMRGRGERCPTCKKREFSIEYCGLNMPIPMMAANRAAVHSPDRIPGEERQERTALPVKTNAEYCTNCGIKIAPDSNFCESCGRKLK